MKARRLRMVAGPNGSGKSTLLNDLEQNFEVGHSLNPDILEKQLRDTGRMSFSKWGISTTQEKLQSFLNDHPLAPMAAGGQIRVSRNILRVDAQTSVGYFTAMLSDFIRKQWIATNQSFTFETVMSSQDKVDLLQQAQKAGYRTYLYFICTSNPAINRQRVSIRVQQGGHNVPPDKISSRYPRTLSLLKDAISFSSRAFIFDNSEQDYRLLAEYESNRAVKIDADLPEWFVQSVLDK